MKRIHLLLLVALITLCFVACGGRNAQDEVSPQADHFETYSYLSQHLVLPDTLGLIQGAGVRNGRIFMPTRGQMVFP